MKLTLWLVGQGVKTPPSHGGIRGSIPLPAAYNFTVRLISLEVIPSRLFNTKQYIDS